MWSVKSCRYWFLRYCSRSPLTPSFYMCMQMHHLQILLIDRILWKYEIILMKNVHRNVIFNVIRFYLGDLLYTLDLWMETTNSHSHSVYLWRTKWHPMPGSWHTTSELTEKLLPTVSVLTLQEFSKTRCVNLVLLVLH